MDCFIEGGAKQEPPYKRKKRYSNVIQSIGQETNKIKLLKTGTPRKSNRETKGSSHHHN